MSVKHLEQYYAEVCNQYIEMKREIESLQEEVSKGLASPEMMDNLKATIKPLMDNYQTMSSIMYMLHKPNRKEKQKKYDKQYKKFIETTDSKYGRKAVLEQNKQVIQNVSNYKTTM